MERNHILEELRDLRNLLNQGNKLANEKTELRFKIERVTESECRLLASVVGQSEEHAIELARCNRKGFWERSGLTSFKKLEMDCANFLNDWRDLSERSKATKMIIQESDFIQMSTDIQKRFDNLLIY